MLIFYQYFYFNITLYASVVFAIKFLNNFHQILNLRKLLPYIFQNTLENVNTISRMRHLTHCWIKIQFLKFIYQKKKISKTINFKSFKKLLPAQFIYFFIQQTIKVRTNKPISKYIHFISKGNNKILNHFCYKHLHKLFQYQRPQFPFRKRMKDYMSFLLKNIFIILNFDQKKLFYNENKP